MDGRKRSDSDATAETRDGVSFSTPSRHDGEVYSITCDDEIEHMGPGWFHIMAVMICGLGNAADAVELLCISYIIPELDKEDETITDHAKSVLSAAVFAGMLVGGLIAGGASDVFGRKLTLLASLGINAVAGAASALSPNWPVLAALRIISGLGVGGSIPSVFTIYVEFLPMEGRGFYLTIVAWFWMIGSIFTAGIAWILIGILGLSWRIFALVCAGPATLALILGIFLLPESPRYFYTKGLLNKCRDVLRYMAKWNGQPSRIDDPGYLLVAKENANSGAARHGVGGGEGAAAIMGDGSRGLASAGDSQGDLAGSVRTRYGTGGAEGSPLTLSDGEEPPVRRASSPGNGLADKPAGGPAGDDPAMYSAGSDELVVSTGPTCCGGYCGFMGSFGKSFQDFFHPSIRQTSVMLTIIWFTLSFGWYGLILWIPSLFAAQDFDLDIYQDAFLVAAANLPGNIISSLLMDRLGRKRLLSFSMMIASGLAVLFAFSRTAALTVIAACLLNMVSVGGWNSLDCVSTESFPTSLRTSAMGILAGSGRLGSMAGQFVFGALIHVSIPLLLVLAAGMLMVGAIAGLFLPHETSGKQLSDTLEQQEEADRKQDAEEGNSYGAARTSQGVAKMESNNQMELGAGMARGGEGAMGQV